MMNEDTIKAVQADIGEAMRRVINSGMAMGGAIEDDAEFSATVQDVLAAVTALRTLKKRAASLGKSDV